MFAMSGAIIFCCVTFQYIVRLFSSCPAFILVSVSSSHSAAQQNVGLALEFMHYIPDATLDNHVWKLMRNPLNIDVDSLPDTLQQQAVEP
jgi:hypothetical protein